MSKRNYAMAATIISFITGIIYLFLLTGEGLFIKISNDYSDTEMTRIYNIGLADKWSIITFCLFVPAIFMVVGFIGLFTKDFQYKYLLILIPVITFIVSLIIAYIEHGKLADYYSTPMYKDWKSKASGQLLMFWIPMAIIVITTSFLFYKSTKQTKEK